MIVPIREIMIVGEIAMVPLTRGLFSIIDAADVDLVAGVNWYAGSNNYAQRKVKVKRGRQDMVRLHRHITGARDGLYVDHINGNPLDNRRANLREATNSQNQANARKRSGSVSPLKGVTWMRSSRKWRAQIKRDGKTIYLGCFDTEQGAHEAYAAAAPIVHGEFARVA